MGLEKLIHLSPNGLNLFCTDIDVSANWNWKFIETFYSGIVFMFLVESNVLGNRILGFIHNTSEFFHRYSQNLEFAGILVLGNIDQPGVERFDVGDAKSSTTLLNTVVIARSLPVSLSLVPSPQTPALRQRLRLCPPNSGHRHRQVHRPFNGLNERPPPPKLYLTNERQAFLIWHLFNELQLRVASSSHFNLFGDEKESDMFFSPLLSDLGVRWALASCFLETSSSLALNVSMSEVRSAIAEPMPLTSKLRWDFLEMITMPDDQRSQISSGKQQVAEKIIRPCLIELAEDPDVDVRFYANQALQSIDKVMMSS
nr:serine/threonine-protein phosphatase 2A 65 kDa regulatory subunit A beta isoform [Ipomoea trifida]